MQRRNLWVATVLVITSLSLAACGAMLRANPQAPQATAPASVERVEGSDLSRVKLTPKGAERIGIKTVQVREAPVAASAGATQLKVVPYGSVLYDSNSRTWVYTNPQPHVYVRHRITVDYIDRNEAVLSDGPSAGTVVVSVGAAELFGIEFETRR